MAVRDVDFLIIGGGVAAGKAARLADDRIPLAEL